MQGVRANGPQRDYGKLQKTQDEAAQRSQAPDAATAVLSRQQLQEMSERYAEVRKAGNLQPTPPELRERNDLAKKHSLIAEKTDRAHGTTDAQQTQQRALLDHQHLAERVGVEARLIGQRLRNQSVPGADIYERESRSALHTARVLHQQRQIWFLVSIVPNKALALSNDRMSRSRRMRPTLRSRPTVCPSRRPLRRLRLNHRPVTRVPRILQSVRMTTARCSASMTTWPVWMPPRTT